MAQAVVDSAFWGAPATGVAAVEHELARLRRAAGAHAREQGASLARASVLNLIVMATREIHARRAARAVAELSLRHPSRAIVVLTDRPSPAGLAARLTLHYDLPQIDPAHPVCYEQILIRAQGDAEDRLASAVIPLLVPDLPVFLWWTDTPPIDSTLFSDLLALAHRLVFDSADFARPDVALPGLAEVCSTGRETRGVTDLNWTRLTPWREFATLFFDVPAWRPFLDGITGVRIGFAVDMDGRDIHPSQALLLLGWIASRLGWRSVESLAPSEAGGLLFKMARPRGGSVMVRIRPRFEEGLKEGDLFGVRLQAAYDGHRAEFVIKRTADTRHMTGTVLIDGEPRNERTVPLPSPDIVELIGEELAIMGSDRIYEDALTALVALA